MRQSCESRIKLAPNYALLQLVIILLGLRLILLRLSLLSQRMLVILVGVVVIPSQLGQPLCLRLSSELAVMLCAQCFQPPVLNHQFLHLRAQGRAFQRRFRQRQSKLRIGAGEIRYLYVCFFEFPRRIENVRVMLHFSLPR